MWAARRVGYKSGRLRHQVATGSSARGNGLLRCGTESQLSSPSCLRQCRVIENGRNVRSYGSKTPSSSSSSQLQQQRLLQQSSSSSHKDGSYTHGEGLAAAILSLPLLLSLLLAANVAPPPVESSNYSSSSTSNSSSMEEEEHVINPGPILLASSTINPHRGGGGGGPSSGYHSAVHLARKKTSKQRRTHYPYVIIGAGTTAFAAVEAILKYEKNAKILMLTDESSLPLTMIDIHNAEKLSPDLLYSYSEWRRHVSSRLESEPEAFTRHPVTLMLGRKKMKLDVEKKILLLDDGAEVMFDRCLVATAGKPRQFYVLDLEKSAYFLRDRVNLLSSLADFEALNSLQDAMECRHVCVVGGGFLGTEVALSMSARGLKVSQVYAEIAPLSRHLPLYLAEYIKDRLTEVGVEPISERLVTSVRCGDGPDDVEKIYVSVMGWENDLLTTDYVVLASTHIDPVTTVAADSGLEIDTSNGGILVNSQMEAVNGVFAAGACASFYDPALGRRRVDSYEHGVYSGQLAGHNMVMTARRCPQDVIDNKRQPPTQQREKGKDKDASGSDTGSKSSGSERSEREGDNGGSRRKQLEVLHGTITEQGIGTGGGGSSGTDRQQMLPPVETGDADGVVVMKWDGRMAPDKRQELERGGGGNDGDERKKTPNIGSYSDKRSDNDGELVNSKGLAREDRSCALQEMPPYSQVYRHQPMFRSRLEALDILMEGVGELESSMRTVGIWLDGKHGSKGLLERKVGEQHESFERGIVYYLNGSIVKGILLYNADDLKDEATQVIRRQPNVRSVNELKSLVALAPDNWLRIVETSAVGENM